MHQISDDWDGFVIPQLGVRGERIKDSPIYKSISANVELIRINGKELQFQLLDRTTDSNNLEFREIDSLTPF